MSFVPAQVAESTLRPVTGRASCWMPLDQETPPVSNCCWTTEPTPTCPMPRDTCPSIRLRMLDTTSKFWMDGWDHLLVTDTTVICCHAEL